VSKLRAVLHLPAISSAGTCLLKLFDLPEFAALPNAGFRRAAQGFVATDG